MRSRLTTLGTSFSSETVTSALHPECTRKPTAACFIEASAAERRENPIYILALEKSRPFLRSGPLTPAAALPPPREQFRAPALRHLAGRKVLHEVRADPRGR